MKRAGSSDDPECQYRPQPPASPFTVYSCRNITMAALAEHLRGMAGDYISDPVLDSTGLDGGVRL